MMLSLEQAATRLGKSRRQVLYAIRKGEVPAEKLGGRWFIESADLARQEPQRRVEERKQQRLRAAVEEALDLEPEPQTRRYSVRDLKAFQLALPLYQEAGRALGEDHAATRALRRVLEQLARGCHRFEHTDKAEAYRQARDEASQAVCELLLAGSAVAERLLDQVEQALMPAFAGLMRHAARRRRP
jgi:excisionase family DNA binding protein